MKDFCRQHAKKLGYPDLLVEPLVLPTHDPRTGRTFHVYSKHRWFEGEAGEKLKLLLKHYRLTDDSPTSMRRLALLLAEDWVPGFAVVERPRRRKGAPQKRNGTALLEFINQIDAIMKADKINKNNKLMSACRKFQEQQGLDSSWNHSTAKNLADLYRDTKKAEHSLRSEISRKATSAGPADLLRGIRILGEALSPRPVKK